MLPPDVMVDVAHGQLVQPAGGLGPGLPLPDGPSVVDGAVAYVVNGGSVPGVKHKPSMSPLPVVLGPFTEGAPKTPLVRTVVVTVRCVM